jgi:hypothetical protein
MAYWPGGTLYQVKECCAEVSWPIGTPLAKYCTEAIATPLVERTEAGIVMSAGPE